VGDVSDDDARGGSDAQHGDRCSASLLVGVQQS
jgi:hypothetical protein